MKLYGFAGSPRTWKVRAVASHLGIPLEYKNLDFAKGETRTAEYLALNPTGRTPTSSMTTSCCGSSDAIMQYLASKKPNGLWPDDPRTRADIMRWQNWQSAHWGSDACMPLLFQKLVKTIFDLGPPDAAVVAKATEAFNKESAVLDAIWQSTTGLWVQIRRSPISRLARISSMPTSAVCRLALTSMLAGGSNGSPLCRVGPRLRHPRGRQWRPDLQKQQGRLASRPLPLN